MRLLEVACLSILLLFTLANVNGESDVVLLDSGNFEHLTQASSGMTTGDWMVEFYAPWCGHCKNLEPIYEEVATALKGEVNVAKVDASKERAIGSRFEIRGFPTILFLSHGKVYKYKGKRTKDALVEFATGGYKDKADDAEPIPAPKSAVQELFGAFTKSFNYAMKDFSKGNYVTPNTLSVFVPLFFFVIMVMIVCLPIASEPPSQRRRVATKPTNATPSASDVTETDKTK